MATILVVDDRANNRHLVTTLLGYGGHRLLEAANGAEALHLVRAERPDLVITDVVMPVMDGYELVQHLRNDAELSQTQVIFHTATYSASEARLLGESCGVAIVLPKPCEPEEILSAVDQALGVVASASVTSLAAKQAMAKAGALRPADDTGSMRYVKDLQAVKLEFEEVFDHSAKLIAGRDLARGLSKQLFANVESLQRVMSHLSALIEVGIEMESERDPGKLVQKFFAAACDIIASKYAAIGILDEHEVAFCHVFAKGIEPRIYLTGNNGRSGLLGSVLSGRRAIRASGRDPEAGAEGLPLEHPRASSVLAVPIVTSNREYGWIYFAGKSGAREFSAEDERFASLMATKFALLYENLKLYDVIQHHAAKLQIEVAERKQAESKIRHLNRVYAVLSGINMLIARVRDREELFREACRIAVEAGGFQLAWLGVVDRGAMQVKPVAWYGTGSDYVQLIPLGLKDAGSDEFGLAGQVVREHKAVVSNDMTQDPRVRLGKEALERGFHSVVVLPLLVADEAVGVLGLYASEVGIFDEAELKLLNELAGDIAFAIDHLEKVNRLDFLAYYDPTTGLPNRTLFRDRLAHSLHGRSGETAPIAVVLLDLERFRRVNDTLGREGGDELLHAIGARLRRANESAARIGTDMFALALRGMPSAADVNRSVDAAVAACFGEPYSVHGEELQMTCRAGAALHPADGADADTLLRNAEAALQRSKRAGERCVFYAPEMNARVAEALAIENKLRRALERREFVLHYQPKVSLSNGSITGVEALIRWEDPAQGLVPPGRFIPVLEETGLIVPVGGWAIEQALTDLAAWKASGHAIARVAVNVSAIQLQRTDFVDTVIDSVQRVGDVAGRLELEITESMLMRDVDASIRKLSALRDLGVHISMDDFGTGYSSLSYLARLPVDTIKIDRSFVNGMTKNVEDATIVSGIIALVHSLRLRVIAEGVETAAQEQHLAARDCDEAQGFFYCRPVPAAQIEALLRTGGTLPVVHTS